MISDIDPNPDNFVSAGIVNTTSVLVGCLVRLEPNKQTKVRIVCVCVGLDPSSVKSQYRQEILWMQIFGSRALSRNVCGF